eukprot:759665-Hanusia_phi.AAC.2
MSNWMKVREEASRRSDSITNRTEVEDSCGGSKWEKREMEDGSMVMTSLPLHYSHVPASELEREEVACAERLCHVKFHNFSSYAFSKKALLAASAYGLLRLVVISLDEAVS